MDAGKYYGEDSGFCLMHNSLKQQCSEAIQKCQLLTYRYAKPNQVLKEIVDTTAIKAKGFDGIRQSSSDYMIYINMVSASIASFENDYARLYQNAGDEDLIGSQLLADRKRLSNQLNEAKKTQQNLKSRKTNTENVAVGENTARITEEQIKTSNRIIDGYTQAIKQINEKIEKYYQIENNTRNYFKQGEEYSTKAQNILKGISKSFKGAEYHYDENADWRVDYQKCADDMNVIYKDRAINYLKYRGVTEDEFKQLAKYNFSSTEVYNYITLTNSKENEEFIMNIIHKKYENSFKKDPSTLDSYAKYFMAKYGLGLWRVMYEKDTKASKDDYMKFINAVLSDNKEIVMPPSITGGKATVKNAEGLANEDMIVTNQSMKYLEILSDTTKIIMQCDATVAKNIYIREEDSKEFKKYQRKWNQDMSCYMLYKSLYNKCEEYSKDVYYKHRKIIKINDIDLNGTEGDDVPTIKLDCEYDDGSQNKAEKLDYCADDSDKRVSDTENSINKEVKEGPHETKDKLSEIAKTMLIVGASEINPLLGISLDVAFAYASDDGITNSYIEGKAKDAVKWVDKKTDFSGKVKSKAGDIYQNNIASHLPTMPNLGPYGNNVITSTKKGVTSVCSLDNLIGLSKAINNDLHFEEKMNKKKKEFLEEAYTSYFTDSDGSDISMQSLDLGTQIYEEMLRKKMRFVCSNGKDDDEKKMSDVEKALGKLEAYKKKHKKEIPKKVYDIAVKLIKGDVVITDIKEKDTKLYYDAVDFIDKSDSEKYVKRFEDGASEVRKKIKK